MCVWEGSSSYYATSLPLCHTLTPLCLLIRNLDTAHEAGNNVCIYIKIYIYMHINLGRETPTLILHTIHAITVTLEPVYGRVKGGRTGAVLWHVMGPSVCTSHKGVLYE